MQTSVSTEREQPLHPITFTNEIRLWWEYLDICSCIGKKNVMPCVYNDVEKMVCSRTPPLSWLWFVPSPGARRPGFYHLWNHPVYGWEIFHHILWYVYLQSSDLQMLRHNNILTLCALLFYEVNILLYKHIVHPVLWACSVCSAAPEVLSGGPYNHAADWWSLGILLFSLVTGKVRACCR